MVKKYGLKTALGGVDLDVGRGEFLSLLGPNGAGKTTLLNILATLLKPTSGEVYVDGVDIKSNPERVRSRIGLISHSLFLYENLTALENLTFYGRMYSVRNARAKAAKLIADVGLELSLYETVDTFSRGMKQRLSIARSLMNDPLVLYLDEPFTGLDQHGRMMLSDILRSLRGGERTIVMATHDLEVSLALSDRMAILAGGRVAFQGETSGLSLNEIEGIYFRYVQQGPGHRLQRYNV